ncbi:BEL1-like homeodomain protein 7 [Musa acuminata AAA Group]|uniref:BEL1-like homeodomain protein 7 n=1 Tax=Musa acuminata AAA Group TaxID=214697 RepID=UPI0031CFD120
MDNTPNLCSRDPGHSQYSEASVFDNLLCHKYSPSVAYTDALANTQPHQNSVEVPIVTTVISQGSILETPNMVTSCIGEHAYDSWKDGKNDILFMQTVGVDGSENLLHDGNSQMNLRRQLGALNRQCLSLQQSDVSTVPSQGLSLSLGTQIIVPSIQCQHTSSDISLFRPHQTTSRNGGSGRDENCENKSTNANNFPYESASLASSILNSKYLKAAQELLDEVVNVQKALKRKSIKSQSLHTSAGTTTGKDCSAGEGMSSNPQDSTINSSSELSPSERQDLQNKVTKLLTMLDEIDRRYKQYYHQMQIVVSSFDVVAGFGAAKPYTALSLQTISGHFRCLRDAISREILVTRKSLGEEGNSGSKGVGMSRLRYIDQQLRQQRAMQQFGMMQQHAWRPQRGLPESSVSILRAWLFEHFLHPYPNDSEKLMLARQTGLTRSQVSNWFINARVRLWKPMIEDMYKEETGDLEIDSSLENPPKDQDGVHSTGNGENSQNTATERCQVNQLSDLSRSNIMPGMDMAGAGAKDYRMNLKMRSTTEECSYVQDALAHIDGTGRFMAYADLGCGGGGGVSLTLGLQHCDGGLPGSGSQQSFVGMQGGDIYSAAAAIGADTAEYDCVNLGDRPHRFASSQLLHDFVA